MLDLDPDFRLCDEGEGAVMTAQVLQDVLEEQYENLQEGDDFSLLVDTLAAGRDDSRLEQIVLDVFGRIQSHPDPAQWLFGQKAVWALEGITDAGQTPWGALLLEDAARRAGRQKSGWNGSQPLCPGRAAANELRPLHPDLPGGRSGLL